MYTITGTVCSNQVSRCRQYGAETIINGKDIEEAQEYATKVAEMKQYVNRYVHHVLCIMFHLRCFVCI